ncbi:MAG: hypothetical protein KDD45_03280, partial [Bdellovibrionales bacterium]|nr:hypothetical protein [Bdellovibrionales bacterium]
MMRILTFALFFMVLIFLSPYNAYSNGARPDGKTRYNSSSKTATSSNTSTGGATGTWEAPANKSVATPQASEPVQATQITTPKYNQSATSGTLNGGSLPKASSVPIPNCNIDEYPGSFGVCEKCPQQSVPVNGKVYCTPSSTPDPGGNSGKSVADCSSNQVPRYSGRDFIGCVDVTTPNSESESCVQQFSNYQAQCISQAASAMTECDQDKNPELGAAIKSVNAIGAGSAVSIQIACSKLADVAKVANFAFASYQAVCSTQMGGCEDSCGAAKRILESECIEPQQREVLITSYMGTLRENIATCQSYKSRIAEAAQSAAAAMTQYQAAKQCNDDTSTLNANNL